MTIDGKPKLLLLHNGPKPDDVSAEHGTFDVQIANCLKAGGVDASELDVEMIVTFDEVDIKRLATTDASKFFAIILSGSKFDVTMRLPWMDAMKDWLRPVVGTVPLLGICFGHQLLGDLLGGEVMYNPRGNEVGTYDIESCACSNEIARDPLASQLPSRFPAVLLHRQSIERLPAGAISFYRTANGGIESNQLVRFAPNTYGTQFHPEYTTAFVNSMRKYLSYGASTPEDETRLDAMVECPQSTLIVSKFVKLFLPTSKKADETGI
jgi:GMP synthase (glutamine-hydrolysing)